MGYFHGSTVVSSSRTYQLTADSVVVVETIIKAGNTNTGIVYVGITGVTAATNAATDGIPLNADESITFSGRAIDNPSDIYTIASTTTNTVYWGYIT